MHANDILQILSENVTYTGEYTSTLLSTATLKPVLIPDRRTGQRPRLPDMASHHQRLLDDDGQPCGCSFDRRRGPNRIQERRIHDRLFPGESRSAEVPVVDSRSSCESSLDVAVM